MANLMKLAGQGLPLVTGLASDAFDTFGSLAAFGANQQRYDESMGLNSDLLYGREMGNPLLTGLPFIGGLFSRRDPTQSIPGLMQGFSDTWTPRIDENYDSVLKNLTGMRAGLIGAGEQERKDINTSFDSARGSMLADMASRGLTSSSLPYTMGNNLLRNRADALGGLDERLRQQRLGFESYALGAGQNAFANRFNNTYDLFTAPLQSRMDLTRDRIDMITGRVDAYPDQGLRMQRDAASGSAWAPAVSMPDAGSSGIWGPLIGAASFPASVATFGAFGGFK